MKHILFKSESDLPSTSREVNVQSLGCILRGQRNLNMKQTRRDIKSQLQDVWGKRKKEIPHDMSVFSFLGISQCIMSQQISQLCENFKLDKRRKDLSEYYLKTLSEAWLDFGPLQLWCFSWAFANFSAAAIGHPDRLKWESKFRFYKERT